ncbi:MAG: hypothetical protein EOP85_08860 [Verrucomicrobiaceae bacterium]|nr:MAG: hypothetical protein EOP85_08860 [Verrucomicrobiaceae bacterium]
MASIWVLRWRLSKRAKALEFHQGKNAMLALATGCAIALIPVAGAAVADEWRQGEYITMGLFSVPAIWLVTTISRSLFMNSPKLLQHAVVARALVPVFAVTALLVFSAVPFYKAAAFHWFDQDPLLRVDPEHPEMSRYKYECAVQLRKETRAMLGYDP